MPSYAKRGRNYVYGKRKRARYASGTVATRPARSRLMRAVYPSTKVFNISRVYPYEHVVVNDVNLFTPVCFDFVLSSLPNYSEFTSLFDQYRINSIDVSLFFNRNSANTGGLPADFKWRDQLPLVYYAEDHDDSTQITKAEMLQFMNLKIKRSDNPIFFRIHPKPSIATWAGAAQPSGYSVPNKAAWLDCSSPGVKHYGLKFGFEVGNTYSAQQMEIGRFMILFKYNMSFKNVV